MEEYHQIFSRSKENISSESGHCWRQCDNIIMGDHFHIFWSCPKIQPFWLEIITEINSILGFEMDNSFGTIYLGNIPPDFNVRDKYLLKILIVACKKEITKKWLVNEPPTKGQWIVIVRGIFDMEKMTFSLRLCSGTFDQYWAKWVSHMEDIPQLQYIFFWFCLF